MPITKRLLISICFLAIAEILFAHGLHHKTQTTPTQTQQTQTSGTAARANQTARAEQEEEKLPPMSKLMMEHMHNKIVHFPLALGLAGVLFVWLATRWPHFDQSAKILWAIAAVTAVAAYFTGKAQSEPFEHGYLHETLETHKTLGISTGISLWIGLLFLSIPKLKRYAWLWAIVVLTLISATGFFGGILAHAD